MRLLGRQLAIHSHDKSELGDFGGSIVLTVYRNNQAR